MITNKMCVKYSNLLPFTFKFTETVLLTSVPTVFVFFVDTISIAIVISSHWVTEILAIPVKYSQMHVLGFQL